MKLYQVAFFVLTVLYCGNNYEMRAADNEEPSEVKRIDMPFIHINVNKHTNGEKDVDVKAPFVHVHNPAGENNAQVKAPFTKIEKGNSTSPQQTKNKTTDNAQTKTSNTIDKTK